MYLYLSRWTSSIHKRLNRACTGIGGAYLTRIAARLSYPPCLGFAVTRHRPLPDRPLKPPGELGYNSREALYQTSSKEPEGDGLESS